MNIIDSLDYRATLMSRDVPIAEIRGRRVYPIENDLVPLCFKDGGGDFGEWLVSRAVDSSRPHSRMLKKVLRLRDRDDVSTVLHVNAVCLTDSYWVKPEGSTLSWEDVRFKKNDFAELALRGDLSCFSKEPSLTPELTNTGSFEKGWKFEDGSWWLYKEANELQKFSELFVYELCKELGFPTAVYEDCGEFVRTPDFTEQQMNLEPAAYLVGDDDDYVLNYRRFKEFGIGFADQYLEVIMMDAFCRNGDRHTGNYGLLRDVESGRILRMAPNFDNNLALLSNGYEPGLRGDDFLAQELRRLEEEEHAISGYAMRNRLPVITPELIEKCCERTGVAVDVPYVQQYVMAGYAHSGVPEVARAQQLGRQVDEILSDAENRAVAPVGSKPSRELGL